MYSMRGCDVTQESLNRIKMAEDSGQRNRHFSANKHKNFDEGDSFILVCVWLENYLQYLYTTFWLDIVKLC